MKSSCIEHIKNEPIIIIRQSYVKFCNGNVIAAALLSFFEYWHNIKLAISEKNKKENNVSEIHGDNRVRDESLYQFHSNEELQEGVLGMVGKNKIISSIKELVDLKILSIHRNPNPRYKFDKTNYFLFNPTPISNFIDSLKSDDGKAEKGQRMTEKGQRMTENKQAITEITTEPSSETTKNLTTLSVKPLDVLNLYNQVLEGRLPKAQELTPARISIINVRTSEHFKTLDQWKIYFDKIKITEFLCGNNDRGWKANLDWIINPTNRLKILEGSLDFANGTKQSSTKKSPIPFCGDWDPKAPKTEGMPR